MSKKYAFLGPESTGKSTTAQAVAKRIGGMYIPEIARDYLKDIGLNYSYKDILEIALLQSTEVSNFESQEPEMILFCDTELITIQIWLEYLNYEVPDWLIYRIKNENYVKYFLCDIDIPWIKDSLRINEHDRKEIMQIFIDKLKFYQKDYVIIQGQGEERIQNVLFHL